MTRYLIVNADDLGISQATNQAIARAFREGVLTSASLMANMPALEHALAETIRPNLGLGVGLHLCLSSGKAVLKAAQVPLLVDAAGHFRHGFLGLLRLLASHRRADALAQIHEELSAQAARVEACGIAVDHVNSHQHVHMIPGVFAVAARIAQERGAALRMSDEPLSCGKRTPAQWLSCLASGGLAKKVLLGTLAVHARRIGAAPGADRCFGIVETGRMTLAVLRRIVSALPPGVSEIFLHPSLAEAAGETLVCGSPDRRFLACPQRAAELAALLDPALRADLAREGIVLARFQDVRPSPAAQRAA